MLYTVAEAANAIGLDETTILRAIEDGHISRTQDSSGGWQIEEVELHRLYLLVMQHYCKQKYCDPRTTSQADIAASDNESDAGVRHEHIDSLGESPDRAEKAETAPAAATMWDNQIRIDERDKISISTSPRGVHETRITRLGFFVLGC